MKITFMPMNKTIEVSEPRSILDIAKEHGIHINSICNGVPSCGECRCYITQGAEYLFPPLEPELELIGTGHFVDSRRLACQTWIYGDLVVDLSEHSEVSKNTFMQKIEKQLGTANKTEEKMYSVTGNLIDQDNVQEELKSVSVEEESRPDRSTPNRAKPNRAKPNRAKPNRAKSDRDNPNGAKPNREHKKRYHSRGKKNFKKKGHHSSKNR